MFFYYDDYELSLYFTSESKKHLKNIFNELCKLNPISTLYPEFFCKYQDIEYNLEDINTEILKLSKNKKIF